MFEILRVRKVATAVVFATCIASPAFAGSIPLADLGNVLLSRSTYEGSASTVTVGQALPGGGTATANGSYPNVFNNASPDASFGVTSPILIDLINSAAAPGANITGTLNVTALAAAEGVNLVTSFSSKSELAINLTPNGSGITFMGYVSTPNQLDVSNSNTPGIIEPGNPVTTTPAYRAVAQLNLGAGLSASTSSLAVTTTNAYAGNNGRAAILAPNGLYYTTGNAGNGNGSAAITAGTGVQVVTPGNNAMPSTPGTSQAGFYNITQQGYAADKTAKDNNFRGETIFNNTLYVTKGSGSNGIDTVYQVGTTGSLPQGSATNSQATSGTITVLPGFPTNLAKNPSPSESVSFLNDPSLDNASTNNPFGIWFANATTLYVADEGTGTTAASGGLFGGLEKWSLVNGTWDLDYYLQEGLNLGQSFTVTGTDAAGDSGSYVTATDGLRNITGQVNADGTVTIYAVTSTISNSGDQGADPNMLVAINDVLADNTASQVMGESFQTIDSAVYGDVFRGVSLDTTATPEPGTWAMLIGGLAVLGLARRKVTSAK